MYIYVFDLIRDLNKESSRLATADVNLAGDMEKVVSSLEWCFHNKKLV